MKYTVADSKDMHDVACDILAALPRGTSSATTLTLSGDLGAGKTTFTQALAKKLGVEGRVTSPTFGIMRSYDIPSSFCEGEENCHPKQITCHPALDAGSPRISSRDNTSKIPDQVRNDNRDDSEIKKEKSCHSGLDPESRECDFTALIHIDAYRLEGGKDMEMLGWNDMLADHKNLIVIEWPERVKDILPNNTTQLVFEHINETTRKITVE